MHRSHSKSPVPSFYSTFCVFQDFCAKQHATLFDLAHVSKQCVFQSDADVLQRKNVDFSDEESFSIKYVLFLLYISRKRATEREPT